MGDTGAFAIGGALSVIVVVSRLQLLLIITGFMFLASSISVILQVGSYKLRKKRVFKMAPLHHHFELQGTPETKIVAFYMLITVLLCLVGILAVN
jgi:phospho-N-acetylmuramoyl-pentapeptide-transferase